MARLYTFQILAQQLSNSEGLECAAVQLLLQVVHVPRAYSGMVQALQARYV